MKFPEWILQPYLVDICSLDGTIQEKFINLKHDESIKVLYSSRKIQMWISEEVKEKYPACSFIARKLLLPFPSSYLVECGFSAVTDLMTKKRNKLDTTNRGDLRLKLTKFDPNITDLGSNAQQQESH